MLELQGVAKAHRRGREQVVALAGVDLRVEAGETLAITGRSGAGKSTLLHIAGGLDSPDEGNVVVGGTALSSLSAGERALVRRRRIGFVFQFFHLLPTLTVGENVGLVLALDNNREREARVEALLAAVGLADRMRHLPGELSGGEMQRAAIARALVNEPRLLLADEPTGNLDSRTSEEVLEVLLHQTRASDAALVLATHDPSVAALMQRVARLEDGVLVEDASRP